MPLLLRQRNASHVLFGSPCSCWALPPIGLGRGNQFFNTFLYNEITPDPRPISWMVAITALVATLTAILMGALSDRMRTRWGRRKPFLVIGYIAWGIITALFPTSANFGTVSAGVFMAILLDSLMTFFGSSANDAAFNAYVADVTTVENRGKVTGALEIMKWVAILIVYGGAGIVIDLVGYPVFFYIIGGMVLLVGLVTAPLIKEEMPEEKPQGSYWQQIVSTFKVRNLRENRDFFLVLSAVAIFGLGQNVSSLLAGLFGTLRPSGGSPIFDSGGCCDPDRRDWCGLSTGYPGG